MADNLTAIASLLRGHVWETGEEREAVERTLVYLDPYVHDCIQKMHLPYASDLAFEIRYTMPLDFHRLTNNPFLLNHPANTA
jgi:hypothetical protein